ncbi:hypothetical protein Anas_03643 [Armadillidium nasatum]|uniref:15-hydroxyprostaglandin dehydrogenase [NAD(+)] n=1 Tax=Armadillidium nasatum TaxID=96803 RepID=A0A5N5SWS2_9CRUS|nr:hypothetical protein Anas_03643 [Armadillidium nasatum]
MNYKGRVVLITGGAGGIAEALGRLFLEKGCKVCLIDIRAVAGKSVVKKLQTDFGKSNILFVKCDVTNDKEFEDLMKVIILKTTYRNEGSVDTTLTTLEGLKKGSLNDYCDETMEKIYDKYPKMKPREAAEAILQVIEEHKPGAALVIEPETKPYYVTPSLLTEYS